MSMIVVPNKNYVWQVLCTIEDKDGDSSTTTLMLSLDEGPG